MRRQMVTTMYNNIFTRENNFKTDITYSGTSIQGTPSGPRKVSGE